MVSKWVPVEKIFSKVMDRNQTRGDADEIFLCVVSEMSKVPSPISSSSHLSFFFNVFFLR